VANYFGQLSWRRGFSALLARGDVIIGDLAPYNTRLTHDILIGFFPFRFNNTINNSLNKQMCICGQVLASTAKNMILLDLGLTIAFPTIVIPELHNTLDPLALNDEQTSWFGK
jgi:hypothetical protein